MIPDTDEQLIAEVRKHGIFYFYAISELRALINHYIALDRAQGQEAAAYMADKDSDAAFKGSTICVEEWKLDAGLSEVYTIPLYPRAQPKET